MTDTPTTKASPDWLLAQEDVKAYTLRAYRIPYFENEILEFVQVEHPDASSSYFRGNGQGGVEPGPFGGGFEWTVPKYVVKAATRFFNEIFPPTPTTEETT